MKERLFSSLSQIKLTKAIRRPANELSRTENAAMVFPSTTCIPFSKWMINIYVYIHRILFDDTLCNSPEKCWSNWNLGKLPSILYFLRYWCKSVWLFGIVDERVLRQKLTLSQNLTKVCSFCASNASLWFAFLKLGL